MKIGFIVETRYLSQAMPIAAINAIKAHGHKVDIVNPDHAYFNVDEGILYDADSQKIKLYDFDLVVSRNRNPLGLVLLQYVEEYGIPTINTHSSIQKVRNKAKMAVTLSIAGVPAAPTLLADDTAALSSNSNTDFPIILKATYGDNCQGLLLVHTQDHLCDLDWDNNLVLAQSYLNNDGYDLKLYVCGEYVFPVRKPSPFNGNPNSPSIPFKLTPEIKSLAVKCGKIFGLELYGVDCIETENGPLVLEVNDFPNYTGIPNIAEFIAHQILSRIEHEESLL